MALATMSPDSETQTSLPRDLEAEFTAARRLVRAPLQKRFVSAFLTAKSGAEAARIAGYSTHTSGKQSSRLLQNEVIRRAVALAWELRAHRAGLSRDLIFTFVADVINADFRDYEVTDEEGNITRRPNSELTYQQARLVQRTSGNGVTLVDKMEAIKRGIDVLFLAQSEQDKADQGLGELTRGWMSSIASKVGDGGRRVAVSDTNGQAKRLPDKKQVVEVEPTPKVE